MVADRFLLTPATAILRSPIRARFLDVLMSIGGTGYLDELSDASDDSADRLLRLIGKATFEAMIEDWTAESLELLRASEGLAVVRHLPDDTIRSGSPLESRLMQALAGEEYPLEGLPASVRDFLTLAVAGTKVLEDETAFCEVAWVASGELAEPVFAVSG